MAINKIDLTCPQCGGTMELNEAKHMLVCPYCGHTEILEEEQKETFAEKAYARQDAINRANEAAEKRKKKSKARRTLIILLVIALFFGAIASIGALIPKTDPFALITVTFSGVNGDGEAEIVYLTDTDSEVDPRAISYHISPQRYLSEGDTVTVTADSDEYALSPTTKRYTVEGLETCLKDLDGLSDKALEMIHNKSDSMAQKALYGAYNKADSFAPCMLYLVTDGKDYNTLYDIYKATFTESDGHVSERYVAVYYRNAIVRDTEEPSMQYDGSMYIGEIIQAFDNTYGGYITAYYSLKDAKADMLTHTGSAVTLKERQL